MQNSFPPFAWWGFPYLKIKTFSWRLVSWFQKCFMFQNIFGTYYQISISCFLIDMEFISKLLEMFLWKSYHFPILIFTILYNEYILIFRKNETIGTRNTKTVSIPFKHFEHVGVSRFSDMTKTIFVKAFPYFLVFVDVFW